MILSSLSAADLKRLTKLLEKRDALKEQVEALNAEIDSFAQPTKATKAPKAKGTPAAKAAPKAKRGKRGKLTESVLAVVKEAGSNGITIKEIAGKLGRNTGAIHTWFFNANKAKRKDVKKIGEAKWQWVG
jgi:septal ring factor EnvC (AmiA/AmiB activator)